jgi:hypothetical protein
MKQRFLIVGLFSLLIASSANADRRKYVWTYGTGMMSPDESELEFYQTTRIDAANSWEYRIELEHGVSPRLDLSVYQIFTQADGGSFKWDAFQIRTRYRLAQPGKSPFDPVLYLEYNRKLDLKRQNKLEGKLLLARDFEKVNIAVNPVYEFFWAPGDPVHEPGLDIGISYELSYKLTIGLESTSRYEILKNEENETSSYFGPTFSFATGSVYYAVGYAWGLTNDSNDARVRFILGAHL